MTRSKSTTAAPVAEICLYGTRETGAGWLARHHTAPAAILGNGEAHADRTFTEAVWQAVARLIGEAGTSDGLVAIYAPCGAMVATVPLALVPSYGILPWRRVDAAVTVTADQVAAAAGEGA